MKRRAKDKTSAIEYCQDLFKRMRDYTRGYYNFQGAIDRAERMFIASLFDVLTDEEKEEVE